ncbi:MAG: N-acetylglucosamine-6-phosphate deacetylase [Candidatus Aureabacteria bacterium]|nr:N-acetylglucosamine-6-phosphate deacetylase [Candidatus Auribacterota bacterium]
MTEKEDSLTIVGGRLIADPGIIENGMVILREGRIAHVGPREAVPAPEGKLIDARGNYVSPGFIDLHVHGAAGGNFLEGGRERVTRIAAAHARYGTTGLLATLGTAPLESIGKGITCLRELIAAGGGENILGINLEGPYLNPVRRGAHPVNHLRRPNRDELSALLDLAGGCVKIVTLAPELEGCRELIELLKERAIVPAVGHSNASLEGADDAFAAGVCYATHLFNGMSGLHHRDPGLAAAVLVDERVTAELIVDGIHVHPLMVKMALMLKGTRGIVLVTDCMNALDMDAGEFVIGERRSSLRDGAPHLDDGTLCGSILTMNRAIMNMRRYTGAPLDEIVKLATINPARVLGLDGQKGRLARGNDADVVIFDDDLAVKTTVINGAIAYNTLELVDC